MVFLPVAAPNVSKKDVLEVKRAVESGWISVNSPRVVEFEREFVRVVMKEKGYGVAVNSGTSALHLALIVLGIGNNDEVLVPDLTMIAVPNAVTYTGAKPVLVDCDEKSWNMNLDLLERAITSKTKAVVVVHTYGVPNEMDKILEICRKHNLRLIEDTAEAMGSHYEEKQLGLFGEVAAFSLYANKNITTGEGGMIFTKNKLLYKEMIKYRHHYFGDNQHFKHDKVGFSYGMTGMQAALGLSQLTRYKQVLEKKRRIGEIYHRMLGKTEVKFPVVPKKCNYLPWMNGVVFKTEDLRERVERGLGREGIETRRFFLPVHKQKPYQQHNYLHERSSRSEDLQRRGLLLPSGPKILFKDVRRTARVILKIVDS